MKFSGLVGLIISLFAVLLAPSVSFADDGYITLKDGERLYYERQGSGDTVVIAPERLFLAPWIWRLADVATVISYDTRNRGASDYVDDASTLTIQQDVKDLEAVRTHFGVDKFVPLGWSYLGLMVIMYAHDYPDHVSRIVQMGPVPRKFGTPYKMEYFANDPPGLFDKESATMRELDTSGAFRLDPEGSCLKEYAVWEKFLVGNPADTSAVKGLNERICQYSNEWHINFARHLEASFGSVQSLDFTEAEVKKVTVPVLTIHGTKDRNAPYGGGREWAYLLPDARLLTIKGAAHLAFAEHPDVVFPAIKSFLAGDWPDGVENVTESPVAEAPPAEPPGN